MDKRTTLIKIIGKDRCSRLCPFVRGFDSGFCDSDIAFCELYQEKLEYTDVYVEDQDTRAGRKRCLNCKIGMEPPNYIETQKMKQTQELSKIRKSIEKFQEKDAEFKQIEIERNLNELARLVDTSGFNV